MKLLISLLVLCLNGYAIANKACSIPEYGGNPEELVNILGGSDSRYELSRGSTLPFIARPWAFNTYAVQSSDESSWWFHPNDRRFYGFRVTHQPSPWINDYGNFLIKTYMPTNHLDPTASSDYFFGYSPLKSIFSPYYFKTNLFHSGNSAGTVQIEFTPSTHGGIMRTTYPKYIPNEVGDDGNTNNGQYRRVSVQLPQVNDQTEISKSPLDGTTMISGYTTKNSGGVGDSEHAAFKHYFVLCIYSGSEGTTITSFDNTVTKNKIHSQKVRYEHVMNAQGDKKKTLHHALTAIEEKNATLIKTLIKDSNGGSALTWVDFDPTDPQYDILTIRMATSFISIDQALENLQQEVSATAVSATSAADAGGIAAGVSFDSLLKEAKAEWNSVLSRIQVAGNSALVPMTVANGDGVAVVVEEGSLECAKAVLAARDTYITFYSSLYRASLFPRQISEVDKLGNVVHWSPYATSTETRVMLGALTTDSGFWDAWNTIYPLLSLYHRPQLAVTIDGWLSAYKEGGWLPKWASPGYRGSMIGTMGDVSLADAIVNEIPGFDVQTAYECIQKDAFVLPPSGVDGIGRVCLDSYLAYGYVPRNVPMTTGGNCYEVVSRTLNYLQSDYAIAQAAKKLGYQADYDTLMTRANNFSLLFDSSTGFFRSKDAKASSPTAFTTPFDQFSWGGDYTESGPWQYRFYVPYNAEGLAALYTTAGSRNYCQDLYKTMTTASTSLFHVGGNGYSEEIHEQTELSDHCFGQYAHNNQPAHYMLYMHMIDGYTGACATQGRYYLRKTLTELYTAQTNMFPGDEDNGEMGAWYVLTAMGLYQRSPGSGYYEFGIPLFDKIIINISDNDHLSTGTGGAKKAAKKQAKIANDQAKKSASKTLTILAKNNSATSIYIQRMTWNNVVLEKSVNGIAYSELSKGGVLVFEMGPSPYTLGKY